MKHSEYLRLACEAYGNAALFTEEETVDEEFPDAWCGELFANDCEEAVSGFIALCAAAGVRFRRIPPEQFGHDLWLTRNGHGAGFWDRGLGQLGEDLSDLARSCGESQLYCGDNGEIRFSASLRRNPGYRREEPVYRSDIQQGDTVEIWNIGLERWEPAQYRGPIGSTHACVITQGGMQWSVLNENLRKVR